MYIYIIICALSSGRKCLLKDLELDETGAKATVMYEHLRGIHKVGNQTLYTFMCDYYNREMAYLCMYFAHSLCTQYSVLGVWIDKLQKGYCPKVCAYMKNLVTFASYMCFTCYVCVGYP